MGRTEKMRGKRTHGAGKKAHRGAGKKGGKGLAGINKHKVVYMHKYMPNHWGVHGFKRPQSVVSRKITLNVRDLDGMVEKLVQEGKAALDGDTYVVDLNALGYDKLLGKGHARHKLKVSVAEATSSAVSKISEAGGSVETSDSPEAATTSDTPEESEIAE